MGAARAAQSPPKSAAPADTSVTPLEVSLDIEAGDVMGYYDNKTGTMVMPPGGTATVKLTSFGPSGETKSVASLKGKPVGEVGGTTVYRTADGIAFVVASGAVFPVLRRGIESFGGPLVSSWRTTSRSRAISAIASTASDSVEAQVDDGALLGRLPLPEAADALRRMLRSPSAAVREAAKVGLTTWSKIDQLANPATVSPRQK